MSYHDTNFKSVGLFTFLTDYTWNKILTTAERRKETPRECTKKTEICNKIPASYNPNVHGYHRECYQSFTNIKYVAKQSAQDIANEMPGCSETKKEDFNRMLVHYSLKTHACFVIKRLFTSNV